MTESGQHAPGAGDREQRLAAALDQLLQDEAGIFAAVRVADGVAYLDGMVESAEQRLAASDLAAMVPGITRVENDLELEAFVLGAGPNLEDDADADLTNDPMVAAEEGEAYMAPTDPVVRPTTDAQGLAIVTGFDSTADDDYPDLQATTALGAGPPGDEETRQEIVEALRSNAQTIDLTIDAVVENGIAYLRGTVPTMIDAEAAEDIASRVPAVREVVEQLKISALG